MHQVRWTLCLAACTVTLGGAGTAAADTFAPGFTPKDAAAARHLRLERTAVALINRADKRVRASRPSCRPAPLDAAPRTTQDTPTQAVLDVLAPLRRPATANDPLPAGNSFFGGFGETYARYVRQATAANGQRFSIIVARTTTPLRVPSSCLDSSHAELVKLLAGKPRALRSLALKEFAGLRAQQKRANAMPPIQDGIFLFTRNQNGSGGGGGGGSVDDFTKHGNFTSSGGSRGSTLNGLLPDGVATITLQYPRRVDRGRYFAPTIYPRAFERTVRVQENVVSLHVPRGAGDAFPARLVWRNAAGKVLRVVRRG